MEGNIGYVPPTKEEFSELLERLGLSTAQGSELLGLNDGGRAIRKYKDGTHKVHYSVLYTIVSRATGQRITPNNWRGEIWIDRT
jgi:hypothetical protein